MALHLTKIIKTKVPSTAKQKVGGSLMKHSIPAKPDRDWSLRADGMMFDTSTTATASRIALELLNDLEKHHYNDGLITGSFVIEKLDFDDAGDSPLHFNYKISLIEY